MAKLSPPVTPKLTDVNVERAKRELELKIIELQNAVNALLASASSGSSGGVPTTRQINTVAPLAGGGDLSADRTLSVGAFGAAASGVVPASGGGVVTYLRADGSWQTPPGAGDVVHTRQILTTAPLTGGGDLSVDRTHAIAANGIDNTLLRQGVAHSVIARAANSTGNVADIAATAPGQALTCKGDQTLVWAAPNEGLFGTGQDGALHFDGGATILGMSPVGNVYTLIRDIMASSITIDNGVTIKSANFRIFVSGTLTNNGTIQCNGGNGGTPTAGALVGAAFFTGAVGGGAGANGNAVGTASSNNNNVGPQPYSDDMTGAVTPASGNNGAYTSVGGSGGAGGANAGGTAGSCSKALANSGAADLLAFSRGGLLAGRVTFAAFGAGGGGGGGGSNGTTGQGGGGGAGGGYVYVAAATLAGTGTISANGGNGGNSAAGNATATGGGGGGGGGICCVVYLTQTGTQTIQALGGSGGAKTGTGTNGGNGHNGVAVTYNLSGDGT